MKLSIVGCAGSYPAPDSAASCYLLSAPDAEGRTVTIALDLGNGSLSRLQQSIAPEDLDAIVLSHLHPDHCLDLCGLYVYRTYHPAVFAHRDDGAAMPQGLAVRLPVYAPEGAQARLERAYRSDEEARPGDDADFSSAFDFRTISTGTAFTIGPFTVTPYRVEHPVEAYALRVEGPSGEVLAYSGDTDSCSGLVQAASGADLFLCEAAFQADRDTVRGIHLTGERAGEAADSAGAAALRLTHIPAWTDAATVQREAESVYQGPVAVVRPGEAIEIRAAAHHRSEEENR